MATPKLARVPVPASSSRPKMQRFKMGLQGGNRSTKRLADKADQQIIINGKFHCKIVFYVKSRNNGELTGQIKFDGKVMPVIFKGSYWSIV